MVAANNGPIDPVKILKVYMTRSGMVGVPDNEDCLFPAMRRVPRKRTLEVQDEVPVPYSTIRAAVLRECQAVGIDVKTMGTHSCRIGGTTEMVRRGLDRECPGLVQDQGRWKDERTKRLYSRHRLDDLLKLSQAFSGCL